MSDHGSTSGILPRLGVLMFIQFFIWGAWYISVSLYMLEHGMGDLRFYAYTAGPLGAIIAPFITGLIADRFFNTERVLATLFLLAGGFMLLLPFVGRLSGTPIIDAATGEAVGMSVEIFGTTVHKAKLFNAVLLAHMICYMPTLGLTASLSFHHLPKGSEQFPLVRLWGTIGWIMAGYALTFLFKTGETQGEVREAQFWLGGVASAALGLYCLTLPKTPAPKRGEPLNVRDLFFVDAWRQMRVRSFAVYIIGSFLVCIPLAAYYASLQQQMEAMDMSYIAFWKNTGTWIEAAMMFLMPFFFRSLGIRKMILIGILAWIVRYGLFALGATPTTGGVVLVIAGIALHGICYDFFFVTGQVYVDRATPPEIRGQAQGMNIFFTQGLGLLLGAIIAGEISAWAFGGASTTDAETLHLWPRFWWPLAGLATVVLVLFAMTFREDGRSTGTTG